MRKSITLFAATGLGLLVAWYALVLVPVNARLRTVQEQHRAVENQLADYDRTVRNLPEFLKANENLELLRGQLNSSLYAKADILELFRQLTLDAVEHNLKLVEISPPVTELLELNRRAVADNAPQFLNVTLDFEGNYIDFGKYVSHLEAQPYFRAVNACTIRGGPILQPTVNLSVSFKALIGTVEEPG